MNAITTFHGPDRIVPVPAREPAPSRSAVEQSFDSVGAALRLVPPPVVPASDLPRAVPPGQRAGPRVEDVLSELSQAAQKTEMYARLSGLWSDFRDSGVVPPPKSYRGIKVLTPTEVMSREQACESGDTPGRGGLSPLEEARITLIQHALRRLAEVDRGQKGAYVGSSESSDGQADGIDVSIPVQATTSDGEEVHIEMAVRYAGSGFALDDEGAAAILARPIETRLEATSKELGDGRFAFEIELGDLSQRREGVEAIPADPADAGLRVWSAEPGRPRRLEAIGEPRRAALYVGGVSEARSPTVRPVPGSVGGPRGLRGVYVAPRLFDASV